PLLMEGEIPLSSHIHAEQDEGSGGLQGRTLHPNSTIEIENDPANPDSETYSAHDEPLTEEINALNPNERMEDRSAHAITSSDVSDCFDGALALSLLNRANFMDDITGSRATLGALTFRCINYAAELQKQSKSFLLHDAAEQKLTPNQDISVWIHANPYKFIGILGGTTLSALALATPAILGAIGFSALGPVAGSIAAGWQASMGTVAAGSFFAFLQSAAMGGAALSLFVGIGALGGAIAVGVGLASLKGIIDGLVKKFRGLTAALAENFKGAMGALVGSFMGFFGKTKDD
ncbi:MAG: hypothetical protein M1812_008491, partial [Candelaria pacifica]